MATTHFSGPVESANGFVSTSDTILQANDYTELASIDVTISSAELLALFTTPITVIPAPGANTAAIPLGMILHKPAGTAYGGIAAGEDLVLKYTDASGAQCISQVEATGFLDQATAQTRYVGGVGAVGVIGAIGDITPVANAAVVIHLLTGNITTGDTPLYLRVFYKTIPTVLS